MADRLAATQAQVAKLNSDLTEKQRLITEFELRQSGGGEEQGASAP